MNMPSADTTEAIGILAIPPYYESHFEQVLDRLINSCQHLIHQIFTIDKKFPITIDVSNSLHICRRILREQEHIQMLIADSQIGQFLAAKLRQEYPQLRSGGMNFLDTVRCANRFLLTQLIGIDECVPTLIVDAKTPWKSNFEAVQTFLSQKPLNACVKAVYRIDQKSNFLNFCDWKEYVETVDARVELYTQQYATILDRFFRTYIPVREHPILFKSGHVVQPFLSLETYPHWRLVIASACIFDNDIIMWPLVDGYSGWPFLAEKPLAILPIIICPSRQISIEQQSLIYARFRQHIIRLINNHHLRYGWIQCSYFISCENQIQLLAIKPTYSVYLSEAFNQTNQHGHPHAALVQLALRQRPKTPILNGKTVYLHRLWSKTTFRVQDLINTIEVERIQRSNICTNRYVRLCFHDQDIVNNENESEFYTELGFIQVHGEYSEIGLSNLIEFRYALLQKPEFIPFAHHSMLCNNADQFDPITCLPSNKLLNQLVQLRDKTQKDLV